VTSEGAMDAASVSHSLFVRLLFADGAGGIAAIDLLGSASG
jgi:hypothetical protein